VASTIGDRRRDILSADSAPQLHPYLQEPTTMTIAARFATLASTTAIATTLLVASAARAQEGPLTPKPTPEHELLKKDVGNWDATVKFWEQPGGEAQESKATEKNELLPGGYWLISRFEGAFGPAKFVGMGTWGYDPEQKEYVGTWVDSMSPYMMVTKADYDAATKTLTGTGESRDPVTGKAMATKSISRYVDNNTRTFEMYTPGPDGKEWKMMEITYKRSAK
jgi:hypothetical protein